MGVRKQLDYRKHHTGSKMDAIKKKMQAMKVEKDNACDRCDVCEEASKVAKVRAAKAEDEVAELATKARQLETELDLTTEKLGIVSLQLEEKEKSLLAAEAEMNALNRRVQGLEEDLEKTKQKQQMQLMKKYLRNLDSVTLILKRLKKEQILEKPKSWSLKKS